MLSYEGGVGCQTFLGKFQDIVFDERKKIEFINEHTLPADHLGERLR
ncbi:MAG: hypothetical protein V2I36_06285 [Desulfopila sp.]|jgi:hypothetical protein|nr:hypothetical protein [Desulfopila sp.]